jgi:hypothetical protein
MQNGHLAAGDREDAAEQDVRCRVFRRSVTGGDDGH